MQLLRERPLRADARAHGGQRADQQADISVQHASQPGASGQCQHTGLGGQVVGDGALHLHRALRQHRCQIGRQLLAQFQHGARQVLEQFAVLLRCLADVAARMRESQHQQHQRCHHDQRGGQYLGPARQARGGVGHAAQAQPPRHNGKLLRHPARDQKAQAGKQQARQQSLHHEQQQGTGHEHIAADAHQRRGQGRAHSVGQGAARRGRRVNARRWRERHCAARQESRQ